MEVVTLGLPNSSQSMQVYDGETIKTERLDIINVLIRMITVDEKIADNIHTRPENLISLT